MEKQRKDDLKYPVDIDIKTSIVENPRLGNRTVDDEFVSHPRANKVYRFFIDLFDKPAAFAYGKLDLIMIMCVKYIDLIFSSS